MSFSSAHIPRTKFALTAIVLVACASVDASQERCPGRPSPQAWHTGPVLCARQTPSGSSVDANFGDMSLASAQRRAIIRSATRSLTLRHRRGGGLIDFGDWDGAVADPLLEITPMVQGLLFGAQSLAPATGAIEMDGFLQSLPGSPAHDGGEIPVHLTWQLDAQDWITAHGAEALRIHTIAGARRIGDQILVGNTVITHNGSALLDQGGVFIASGADSVRIDEITNAWGRHDGSDLAIHGHTQPGAEVRLFEGEKLTGLVYADKKGSYAVMAPLSTERLVAYAPGFMPSEPGTPAAQVDLPIGASGAIDLTLAWPETAPLHPVHVRWSTPFVPQADAILAPEGGLLPTGPGLVTLTVVDSPTVYERIVQVRVLPDQVNRLSLAIDARTTRPDWTLATLDLTAFPSPDTPQAPWDVLHEAVAQGVGYAVISGDDIHVQATPYLDDQTWLSANAGLTLSHPDGWHLSAFPFPSQAALAGDLPDIDGLDPITAFQAIRGVLTDTRLVQADLAWLKAAGPDLRPSTQQPRFVRLDPPGAPPFDAWQPWWDALNAGHFILPTGPWMWIHAQTEAVLPDPTRMQRALWRGALCAGSGPLLELRVDGAFAGELIPSSRGVAVALRHLQVTLEPADDAINRISLISPHGVLGTWSVSHEPSFTLETQKAVEGWVVALGWSTQSPEDWVVSAPIWAGSREGP